MNPPFRHTVTVTVQMADVMAAITAESTWHPAPNATAYAAAADNTPLLLQRIGQAVTQLHLLMGSHVTRWEYYPGRENDNLTIDLGFRQEPPPQAAQILQEAITQALASYALLTVHGDVDTVHALQHRRWTTRISLLLARDALSNQFIQNL